MSSIITNIPYYIMAILAFSLLIIIHELGHFMLAKLNGVKVHEFSLGMGPKLFSIKGKETEYLIKAFPVGGYVKMEGEDEGSNDPRAFNNKTAVQKLSIVSAGAIMNIILAVVLFAIIGAASGKIVPVIGEIVPSGAAMKAGMQVGDKITKVNEVSIDKWEQFINEIGVSKGENISIEIVRNSEVKTFSLKPIKNVEQNRFMVGIGGTQEKMNFGEVVSYGFTQTITTSKLIFEFLGSLFHGKVSVNDVGGPISIIRISTMAAQTGIINLMMLTAMLSVQLGILNILPFPALDGGWIFMLLFEIISGKKLDDKKVGFVNYIGFMIIMAFMVFIVVKDIVSPMKF
ncbi:RIP metalloprotease RseP [Clostridium sp.]|uniref:RIP metalloprotease RseP n=1 Tax=Clostridium sp. TaxID=1506 RepID=UPI001A3DE54F|nr:RIP metalloprotease RseP [Clostridium sp.]MBK5234890.1 RIP metalloprotease RseP [Clostridium sp.]